MAANRIPLPRPPSLSNQRTPTGPGIDLKANAYEDSFTPFDAVALFVAQTEIASRRSCGNTGIPQQNTEFDIFTPDGVPHHDTIVYVSRSKTHKAVFGRGFGEAAQITTDISSGYRLREKYSYKEAYDCNLGCRISTLPSLPTLHAGDHVP